MHISFAPQRRGETLTVSKSDDVLTINGEAFDFSSLPDGGTIRNCPARPGTGDADTTIPCPFILGPVHRINGDLQLTLVLPFKIGNRHVEAPPPLVDPPDGILALPKLDPEEEEPADVDA